VPAQHLLYFRHIDGGINYFCAIQPMLDVSSADEDTRMIERSEYRRNHRIRRDRGVYRSRAADGISGVGMMLVGNLILDAARAGLAASPVRPFVDALNQVLDPGIAAGRQFPVELQIEGAKGIFGPNVLRAIGAHHRLKRTVLDTPAVRGERLAGDLEPAVRGAAVEQKPPAGVPLIVGKAIRFGCGAEQSGRGDEYDGSLDHESDHSVNRARVKP